MSHKNHAMIAAIADDIHDYILAFRGLPAIRDFCEAISHERGLPPLVPLYLLAAVEHGFGDCSPGTMAALIETARAFHDDYCAPLADMCAAADREQAHDAFHESLLTAAAEAERALIVRLTKAALPAFPTPRPSCRSIDDKRHAAAALFALLADGTPCTALTSLLDAAYPDKG